MTHEDFVEWAVLALIAGGQRGEYAPAAQDGRVWVEGYCMPAEKVIAIANEFADALYGPKKQVESDEVLAMREFRRVLYNPPAEQVENDEVLELREAFVDVYRLLLACKEDPSRAKCGFVIDTLDGYRPLYSKCRKVLGREDDDAC